MSSNENKPQAATVLALTKCVAEGCSKKPERLAFCAEHYSWFKFGLVKTDGKRPTDFDKKMVAYLKQKNKKAA